MCTYIIIILLEYYVYRIYILYKYHTYMFILLIYISFIHCIGQNSDQSKGESICQLLLRSIETISEILIYLLDCDGQDTTVAKACQIALDASFLTTASNTLWLSLEQLLIHYRWSDSLHLHMPRAVVAVKIVLGVYIIYCIYYIDVHILLRLLLTCVGG